MAFLPGLVIFIIANSRMLPEDSADCKNFFIFYSCLIILLVIILIIYSCSNDSNR
jgi:hypothetical protein